MKGLEKRKTCTGQSKNKKRRRAQLYLKEGLHLDSTSKSDDGASVLCSTAKPLSFMILLHAILLMVN